MPFLVLGDGGHIIDTERGLVVVYHTWGTCTCGCAITAHRCRAATDEEIALYNQKMGLLSGGR